MKAWLIVGLLVTLAVSSLAEERLSEVQRLKAENFQLKVQVAQLQATLADREARLRSIELSAVQAGLVEEFRHTLQADTDDVFDWRTLTFTTPEKETPQP